MTVVGVLQLVVAGVFAWAATGKMIDHHDMEDALRQSRVPVRLVPLLVILVPVLETVTATTLVGSSALGLRVGFGTAAGILMSFTLWMIWVRTMGRPVRCGCFGRTATDVSTTDVGRNLLLVAAAIGGFVLVDSDRALMQPSSVWTFAAAITGVLVVMLAAGVAKALPALKLTAPDGQARGAVLPAPERTAA